MTVITAEKFMATRNLWNTLIQDELGAGMYANVYSTIDPDKVIKHGTRMTDGWVLYALWCMAAYRGPQALKVYAIKITQDGYYALMERAEKTFHGRVAKKHRKSSDDFCDILASEFPGICLDVHDGNIMLRYDKTVVVTDPLAGVHRSDWYTGYAKLARSLPYVSINKKNPVYA